jgi:transposase
LIKPSVKRDALLELIAKLPPCVVGMEACSGAHHWARQFQAFGHTVRLMAPKFVAPYRLSGRKGKNDAADAQAICEAVQRPHMRFVPIKSEDAQGRLSMLASALNRQLGWSAEWRGNLGCMACLLCVALH